MSEAMKFEDAFNQVIVSTYSSIIKKLFQEFIVDEPKHELFEKKRVTVSIRRGISVHRWVLQRFNVNDLDNELVALYEGFTHGMNNDKAIYWLSHLGTVLNFSIPMGVVIKSGGGGMPKVMGIKRSGIESMEGRSHPLQEILEMEAYEFSKSAIMNHARVFPDKIKYRLDGISGNELEIEQDAFTFAIPRQGKTVVTTSFLSYIPGGDKTKGVLRTIPVMRENGEVKDHKFEIGPVYATNLAKAYRVIRWFRDIPEICKSATSFTGEIPNPFKAWKGYGVLQGSLAAFLSLRIAQQKFKPDDQPITLKEFVLSESRITELVQVLQNEYGDISHFYKSEHR
ncbi:MAG: hypothetical protein ACXAAQ_15255 [Candidatus Thorarchaeota archaeon]